MAPIKIKKLNVLFISLLDFNSLNDHNIYTDLLSEFYQEGHNLFVVSPKEKRNVSGQTGHSNDRINIIKPKIGNITQSGLIEKGFATLVVEKKISRAIRKNYPNTHFDLILYTTPPVTFVNLIYKLKSKHSAITYLLLKDIFPQNALDLNILNTRGIKGLIYKYFKFKERFLYRTSDFIGCMSEANREYLLNQNPWLPIRKLEVNPNSEQIEEFNFDPSLKNTYLSNQNIPINKKLFVYGGNLGKPQGVEFILEAIKANEKNSDSYFILVGNGTEFKRVQGYLSQHNILNTKLMSTMPKIKYNELVSYCDVGLIFLDHRFTIPNFPSRIISYMKHRKPVLIASDSATDIGLIAKQNGFGDYCRSDDVITFNQMVQMYSAHLELSLMGEKAYQYFKENYTSKHSYKIIMNRVRETHNGL
jgi:hypothetical protein